MKKLFIIILAMGIATGSQADELDEFFDETVSTKHAGNNTLYVEFAGRAGVISFNFDKIIWGGLAVGTGFALPVSTMADQISRGYGIPVYFSYFLMSNIWHPYITAGINAYTASRSVDQVLGAGIEHRAENGFLFRFGPYASFARNRTEINYGAGFGCTF